LLKRLVVGDGIVFWVTILVVRYHVKIVIEILVMDRSSVSSSTGKKRRRRRRSSVTSSFHDLKRQRVISTKTFKK